MLIFIVTIGYLIGIVWGLCAKSTIVPFLLFGIAIIAIIKKITSKNLKRYLKFILKKQFVIAFVLSCIISNTVFLIKEEDINSKIQNIDNTEITAILTITSDAEEKEYKYIYNAKIEVILSEKNNIQKEEINIILRVKKSNQKLKYGDKIKIIGRFEIPEVARNEGGFDYKQYLKTKEIYGIVNAEMTNIKVIKEDCTNIISRTIHQLKNKIDANIHTFLQDEPADLLTGILIGDTTNLSDDVKENFRASNLSHMLAVSGAHTSYVILGVTIMLTKIKRGEIISKLITIIVLVLFMLLTGATPSVMRATLMATYIIIASLIYKKISAISSISISLLVIMTINPYNVLNVGLQLSFLGTLGIVVISKCISKSNSTSKIVKKEVTVNKIYVKENIVNKIVTKIKNMLQITLSANITIIPVMIAEFNTISLTFLISNLLASPLLGIIILLGFTTLFASIICMPIAKILAIPLKIVISMLLKITQICGKIPLSQITIATPNVLQIGIYYLILILILISKTKIQRSWHKKFVKNYKKVIICLITIFLISSIKLPHELQIYFIDVGQGDSCLIITPQNKTILIDGGGSETSNYDIGKQILLPFLLNKGITKLDYVLISHFDSDHCGGILSIMQQIKIENAIIGTQFKTCANYEQFKNIANQKQIKVTTVESGNKINIENNLYFDILWPDTAEKISDNVLNNNSIVCKLIYKKISVLFTGDIEAKAEQAILKKYEKNLSILKTDILKAAHHGSKTSSTIDFLKAANPQIALIGVGEKNTFGHPSQITLNNLQLIKCIEYRTDKSGQISIKSDGINIEIKKFIE